MTDAFVVGGDAAGMSAANKAKRENPDEDVIVFGRRSISEPLGRGSSTRCGPARRVSIRFRSPRTASIDSSKD